MLCPNNCLRLHRSTESGESMVHAVTWSQYSLGVSSCPGRTQWMLLVEGVGEKELRARQGGIQNRVVAGLEEGYTWLLQFLVGGGRLEE